MSGEGERRSLRSWAEASEGSGAGSAEESAGAAWRAGSVMEPLRWLCKKSSGASGATGDGGDGLSGSL